MTMKNRAARNRLNTIRVPEKAADALVEMLFQMVSSEPSVAPISIRPCPEWIRRHPYSCVITVSIPGFSVPEQGPGRPHPTGEDIKGPRGA